MDKPIVFSLILIVASGLAYYLWQEREAEAVLSRNMPVEKTVNQSEKPDEEVEKKIEYPLPDNLVAAVQEEPDEVVAEPQAEAFVLPELDASDQAIQAAVSEATRYTVLVQKLIFANIIRHLVVTIDNLTAKKLPRQFAFTQRPDNKFVVEKTELDTEFFLNEENYKRYQPYMDLLSKIDNQQLVSMYVRYYPLFQEAYDELGYSNRYFNDRVVEILDHLLQTPAVSTPIKLIQPKVYFQFADPNLEKLSAGQKVLVRIGAKNGRIVRQRLQELRKILTTFKP
ncbi:MAG: DUF3014 domain-containing protein [Gammaproteobacteria bacterium]|nr:DUF3014 domain-containing protein [Gammaproteobacteria bacterium]